MLNPADKNETLLQPWDKSKSLETFDLTDISYPGIIKIVLNLPDKKKVLFCETKQNTWLEFHEFIYDLEFGNNTDYPDLREDMRIHKADSFDFCILESDPRFLNSKFRKQTLQQLKTEFFNNFPDFKSYIKHPSEVADINTVPVENVNTSDETEGFGLDS